MFQSPCPFFFFFLFLSILIIPVWPFPGCKGICPYLLCCWKLLFKERWSHFMLVRGKVLGMMWSSQVSHKTVAQASWPWFWNCVGQVWVQGCFLQVLTTEKALSHSDPALGMMASFLVSAQPGDTLSGVLELAVNFWQCCDPANHPLSKTAPDHQWYL